MDDYFASFDPSQDHKQFVANLTSVLETRGYCYDTALTLLTAAAEFPDAGPIYDGPILVLKRQENLPIVQYHTTARDDKIYVFPVFCQTGLNYKMGVNHVRSIANAVEYMITTGTAVNHILIIHGSATNSPNGLTPAAAGELMKIFNNNPIATTTAKQGLKQVYYETFSYKQFQFNPIMWTYEVVSAPATGTMNYMLWSDAQRKFHDWPPGTIVSRARQRGSLCEDTSVRIVREP